VTLLPRPQVRPSESPAAHRQTEGLAGESRDLLVRNAGCLVAIDPRAIAWGPI
jgi:hypothetical protein